MKLEDLGKIFIKNIPSFLFFFAICIIFFRLTSFDYSYHHPDEIITIKVAENIIQSNKLNSNWAYADLPYYFKYPQYNFSSYIILTAGLLKLKYHIWLLEKYDDLNFLRVVSGFLGVVVILLTGYIGKRLFNTLTGAYASLLVAINPLLYQDSLYARPEAFVTLAVLIYMYILWISRFSARVRILTGSIILGWVVATKISLIMLASLIFLVDADQNYSGSIYGGLWEYMRSCLISFLKFSWIFPLGFVVGFFIGAPYALFNINDFLYGVGKLNEQYNTGHWPHGLSDGHIYERFFYSVNYFFPTMGILLFFFLISGAWLLIKDQNFRLFCALIIFVVFFFWFSFYPVFFERNFSHLFPFLIIISSFGFSKFIQICCRAPRMLRFRNVGCVLSYNSTILFRLFFVLIISLLFFLPSAITFSKIRFFELPGKYSQQLNLMRNEAEKLYGVDAIRLGWMLQPSFIASQDQGAHFCRPTLVELLSAGDRYMTQTIASLKNDYGFKEVCRFDSPFISISPSTLHTYFSPSRVFLLKEPDSDLCSPRELVTTSKQKVGDIVPNI